MPKSFVIPRLRHPTTNRLGIALLAVGFAIAYFIISRVSLSLVDSDSSVAVLWPASGLALAVVMKSPRRIWPAMFAAVFTGNLVAQTLGRGEFGATTVGLSLVNAAEPLVAATLLLWMVRDRSGFAVGSVRGVGGLVAAATLANGVTATLGALVLAIGVGAPFGAAFGDWWLADGLGMLSVAPPILAALERDRRGGARREGLLLVGLTLCATLFLCDPGVVGLPSALQSAIGFPFLVMPLLVWTAVRTSPFTAGMATLGNTLIFTIATLQGDGPFVRGGRPLVESVLTLQGFLAGEALIVLIVCGVLWERGRVEAALRTSEQRLRDVFDTVDLLATITTVGGKIDYINEALAAMCGRTPDDLNGHDWIETLSADSDADVVEYFYAELRAGRIVRHDENSIENHDGDERLIAWSNTILHNPDGSVYGAASIGQDITDQRVAEAALRESEQRFRMLSTLAPVGIFRTDADGGCVYANHHWCETAGLSAEQATGSGWTAALHPDDRLDVANEWVRAAEAGEEFSMDFRFQRPDDSISWVHATAVALHDRNGSLDGYLGTTVDITDRLAAAELVAGSERRLRTITDNMTDVIFVYGMDRRLQYVTPSFEQLTGFTVAELYARNLLNDVHPDDKAEMRQVWRSLFEGDSYSGAEFRIINRDGSEKWCWSSGSPILNESGEQVGAQIRDADITSLKRAELRLRESEERARSIIETTSDAYLAADASGVIVEWNGAAERTFGCDRAAAIGRRLVDVIPAEQSRTVVEQALRSRDDGAVELVARHRDAGEFPAELTVWHVDVGDARTANMFVRDITERKLREEQVTFMAYHDKLTGLPNRALFEQHLELVLVRARHDGSAAGLLYLDLDRFKQVNDSLGHAAGDELLREVAARLRKAARSGDLVVRLGGDEFVLVLGDLPADDAANIAATVAARVQGAFAPPFAIAGVELRTTASIGVALFPDDAADAKGLVTAADVGMYVSKRGGRGRTSFAAENRHAA
jgi:diguanylate cyclase (GGDEF)-like protein/PAS domain S-box-containing protein